MFGSPNGCFRRRAVQVLAGIVLVAVLLAGVVLAWLRFSPVTTAAGWHYTAVPGTLERITSLARLPDGVVVATLASKQKAHETGQGQLVSLDTVTGKYMPLATGLFKPDGLLPYDGGIVVTQEYAEQPVLFWKNGHLQPLMLLAKPESIVLSPEGQWLVIEDSRGGRLLSVDPHTQRMTVLYQGFEAGEGVCIGRDQRIFVVDNKATTLQEYQQGRMQVVLDGLNGPGFLRCTPAGIWITEDVTNNGRLLFYDYRELHIIARHLHSPQSVLEDGDNAILVAEQGRSRLLRFTRQ